MAGQVGAAGVSLHEVHRFANLPVTAGGTLYWDILRLLADVRHGLELAARQFPLASAGIDSWGVDYGLLDETGALLGNPVHYRDARTAGVAARADQEGGAPAAHLPAAAPPGRRHRSADRAERSGDLASAHRGRLP
jgi:sugar (pentulose or hexulose) kinase